MSVESLIAASSVYKCATNIEISRQTVDSNELEHYSLRLQDLYRNLGENRQDSHWKEITRTLYRYREQHSITPIPLNNLGSIEVEEINWVRNSTESTNALYPSFTDKFSQVITSLNSCLESDKNDILSAITNTLSFNEVVLVKDRRHAEITEHYFGNMAPSNHPYQAYISSLKVLTPEDLRFDEQYSRIIVIGSPGIFPEYVFTAPRSPRMDIFSYRWIRDSWKPKKSFEGIYSPPAIFQSESSTRLGKESSTGSFNMEEQKTNELEINEITLTFDWDQIRSGQDEQVIDGDAEDTFIDVRLIHIESGEAVYLAKDGRRKILDMEEEEGKEVTDIYVEDIEPGMFLLHRTGQGGDVIRDIADQILGSQSFALRSLQEKWKRSLSRKVEVYGMNKVTAALEESGLKIANPPNIRNWMSRDSLRTRSFHNFEILMTYINLNEESQSIWEAMETLTTAHRQAGHFIKRELLKAVSQVDIKKFLHEGHIDFTLPGMMEQRLTASRIQYIREIHRKMPASVTDILFTPEIS